MSNGTSTISSPNPACTADRELPPPPEIGALGDPAEPHPDEPGAPADAPEPRAIGDELASAASASERAR